jgi:hypothetical protein
VAKKAIDAGFTPYRITENRTLEPGVYESKLGGVSVAQNIGHLTNPQE